MRQLHVTILIFVLSVAGACDQADDAPGTDSAEDDPDAAAEVDPADLPPGGTIYLTVSGSSAYGQASLWREVADPEAADEATRIETPPGADELEVEPADSAPVAATRLDIGASFVGSLDGDQLTYERDAASGDYRMQQVIAPPEQPVSWSLVLPATADRAARAMSKVLDVEPVAMTVAGAPAVPTAPFEVTWSGGPDDALVLLLVIDVNLTTGSRVKCSAEVVNDGSFTFPDACVPEETRALVTLLSYSQALAAYGDQRIRLQAAYQTQVNLGG
jgi:hypothetical protein